MKILEGSVKLNNDDTIRVEVQQDDGIITPIDNFDVANKTKNQIKQEIKNIIVAKKAKRDNLIVLKGQLEGEIL